MAAWLFFFVLVLTRISAFMMVAPVFSWHIVPVNIRAAVAVVLSLFFCVIRPTPGHLTSSALPIVLLIFQEGAYGLVLGLIFATMFTVVQIAGRMIERQMGLAMAEVMDPLTGERTQPVGSLLDMVFVLLFLASQGHHLLLQCLARSFSTFPVGSMPSLERLLEQLISASTLSLVLGLQMAAPIMGAFIVLSVVLAFLARIVPEMNILFISMPVRVGLGILMSMGVLSFINQYVLSYARWVLQLLPM